MITLLVLGLFAAASGAPHYHHRQFPFDDDFVRQGNFEIHPAFGEEIFDTRRFWTELETQIHQMDEMLANFHLHFPNSVSTAGVVGNEYKITVPLVGFEEKDIVVKAREGVLMVQAVHKFGEGSERSYIDVRNLPTTIDITGVWTYENDVLTIIFPLKSVTTTEAPEITTEIFTIAPESREEMAKTNDNDNRDADVGLKDDDSTENAIHTNEISNKVEATTYAVDLKNEVEFVPVRYR